MGDSHTSKTKLDLRDRLKGKPPHTPRDPHIGRDCEDRGKKCATDKKSRFQEVMGEYGKSITIFGPKQVQILSCFRSSIIVYSVAAMLATAYVCEWEAVLQYVPYYNGKYKRDE